jgi:hypothetical protein
MNCLENFYLQLHNKQDLLINEQTLTDTNRLYAIIQV